MQPWKSAENQNESVSRKGVDISRHYSTGNNSGKTGLSEST